LQKAHEFLLTTLQLASAAKGLIFAAVVLVGIFGLLLIGAVLLLIGAVPNWQPPLESK
jgi:hypothetical protein